MVTKARLVSYARALLVSAAALLSAACSTVSHKCELPEIPGELLQVPPENQMCELLQIFDPRSCSEVNPASNSANN